MEQEARKRMWTELQPLIQCVDKAYENLERDAWHLANGEDVLSDLSPNGELAVLAHRAGETAGAIPSDAPPRNPLALSSNVGLEDWKPVLLDPLRDLSRAVSTLRKLVQWQNVENEELEKELNWLVPPIDCIIEMGGDSPLNITNGKVFGATRAWFASTLASWFHEGRNATQKLVKRADAGVKEEAAEKKISELEIKAHLNIRKQIREEFNEHDKKLKKERRCRGRKQGGQKKDDDKALEALRKQLAVLAEKTECKRLTQEELIEKGIEIVNRDRIRLHCKWENYRRLLPSSRKRSRKQK